jgi:hypothetical protein
MELANFGSIIWKHNFGIENFSKVVRSIKLAKSVATYNRQLTSKLSKLNSITK